MPTELMLPPWVRISGGRYTWLSNTAAFPSTFTGAIRSTDRLGDRVAVNVSSASVSHDETYPHRANLSTLLAKMRGQSTRVWYTEQGYSPRGSFAATELLTNNTFASGTTGWEGNLAGESSLSASDRVLRVTRTAVTAGYIVRTASDVTVTQYAPYVARVFTRSGRGVFATGDTAFFFGTSGSEASIQSSSPSSHGLNSVAFVPSSTSGRLGFADIATGKLAGDYFEIPYVSLSRCALMDNAPNLLLQSDELDATWTATRASVDDQTASTTAPDGTSTADSVIEDATASNSHFISQDVTVSSAAADYSLSFALKAGARTWAFLQLLESTGGHAARAWINLSSGAVGTVSTSGANLANLRAFSVSLGNGWYKLTLVARKVSAATSLSSILALSTADNTLTYSGNGTSNIYAWRGTLAQSSVPTRLSQTTSSAVSSGTSQTGPGYYTKGWPASTSGLLLADDWVQIGGQLNKVTAPVNSDASGLAYLQLAYPFRSAPSDNAAVIIHEPFGRFVAVENEGGYDFNPEGSNHEFNLVEDLAA